jgi:hypothetical protein
MAAEAEPVGAVGRVKERDGCFGSGMCRRNMRGVMLGVPNSDACANRRSCPGSGQDETCNRGREWLHITHALTDCLSHRGTLAVEGQPTCCSRAGRYRSAAQHDARRTVPAGSSRLPADDGTGRRPPTASTRSSAGIDTRYFCNSNDTGHLYIWRLPG